MEMSATFWTITQNNSGGYFDHDAEKGIGYAICVEAIDKADAERRLRAVIENYPESGDCPCCGARWSIYFWEDEGDDQPKLYDEPLKGGWGVPSYCHYLNGSIVAFGEVAGEKV